MPHTRPDRVPGGPRSRALRTGAIVALVATVLAGCVELTPPPATQPPPSIAEPAVAVP